MAAEISTDVYLHQILNLPSLDRSFDINLNFINNNGDIILSEKESGYLTHYKLKILNPSRFHILGTGRQLIYHQMSDLILACNLNLNRTCITLPKTELSLPDIVRIPAKVKVSIEKSGSVVNVKIDETITMSSSVHVTLGHSEEIDLSLVIQCLDCIHKLDRRKLTRTSPQSHINLGRSLNAFESAMNTFHDIFSFNQLATSINQATNWEGLPSLSGNNLDNEIARLASINSSDAEKWRRFYNRTRHIDSKKSQVDEYFNGIEELPSMRQSLRSACNKVIIDRLRQV